MKCSYSSSKFSKKKTLGEILSLQKTIEKINHKTSKSKHEEIEKFSARSTDSAKAKLFQQLTSKNIKTDNSHKKTLSLSQNCKNRDFFIFKGSNAHISASFKEKVKRITSSIENITITSPKDENISSTRSHNKINNLCKTYSNTFGKEMPLKIKLMKCEKLLERKTSTPNLYQRSPRTKKKTEETKEILNSGSTKLTTESSSSLTQVLVKVSKALDHYKQKEQSWQIERESLIKEIEVLKGKK